jgi:hypothetical protein
MFTASIARKYYFRSGAGIGRLQNMYGDAKRRGSKPKHHFPASGSVIRAAVKQLEALQVLEKDPKGYVPVLTRFPPTCAPFAGVYVTYSIAEGVDSPALVAGILIESHPRLFHPKRFKCMRVHSINKTNKPLSFTCC